MQAKIEGSIPSDSPHSTQDEDVCIGSLRDLSALVLVLLVGARAILGIHGRQVSNTPNLRDRVNGLIH